MSTPFFLAIIYLQTVGESLVFLTIPIVGYYRNLTFLGVDRRITNACHVPRLPSRQLNEVIGRHLGKEAECLMTLMTFAWFNHPESGFKWFQHIEQPGCWMLGAAWVKSVLGSHRNPAPWPGSPAAPWMRKTCLQISRSISCQRDQP